MSNAERYLRPEVIRQVARLDLRARFIVEGFLSGLHRSPFQGFSVEFSEHRKYVAGDDPKDLDWNVYAKTGKYYIKKFQAETNLTGWLVMDRSASMAYTYRQELTKFDYSICLAAALGYLMIYQQDPVGLVTIDTKIDSVLPPKSKRTQLGSMLALLAGLQPSGQSDLAAGLLQLRGLVRNRGIIMIFSDLLADPEPIIKALQQLRHRGHEIILFHVLDEAEVHFPFDGTVEFRDPETDERLTVDTPGLKQDYLAALKDDRDRYKLDLNKAGIDYVPLDTSINFDKALIEYLTHRSRRF